MGNKNTTNNFCSKRLKKSLQKDRFGSEDVVEAFDSSGPVSLLFLVNFVVSVVAVIILALYQRQFVDDFPRCRRHLGGDGVMGTKEEEEGVEGIEGEEEELESLQHKSCSDIRAIIGRRKHLLPVDVCFVHDVEMSVTVIGNADGRPLGRIRNEVIDVLLWVKWERN